MVRREDDVQKEPDLHEQVLDRRRVADAEHAAHDVEPEPRRPRAQHEDEPSAREEPEPEQCARRERHARRDRRAGHAERRQAEPAEDEPVGQDDVHRADCRADRQRRPRVAGAAQARHHDEEQRARGYGRHDDPEKPRAGDDHRVVHPEGGDERRRPRDHRKHDEDRDRGAGAERLAERLLRLGALARSDVTGDDREHTGAEREHHGVDRAEDLDAHADAGHRRRSEPADHQHVAEPDERLDREGEDDGPCERPRRPQEIRSGCGLRGHRDGA